MEVAGPLGTPLGLAQRKRASPRGFQGKPFNITVIQVYAPTSNAGEAEVERFYEDLQDLLERNNQKVVLPELQTLSQGREMLQ